MNVKVLGSGCSKCKKLEQIVREAMQELGLGGQLEKVTDFAEIVRYPVLATPALVVDEKVVCFGYIPSKDEVKAWLTNGQRP